MGMAQPIVCFGTGDNLSELYKKFNVVSDPRRFAGGFAYFCLKCEQEADLCVEAFFDCQGMYIPTRVVCHECGVKWNLKINRIVQKM